MRAGHLPGPERPGPMACGACVAVPGAVALATGRADDHSSAHASGTVAGAGRGAQVFLALPRIHCALCIAQVEGALAGSPGVRDARVNLTLRRVVVTGAPGLAAAPLIARLAAAGHEAHELDPDALAATQGDRAGRDLLMRIAVAGFAMMNIMLLSVAVWSGAEAATRDLFHWISAAIALPTVAFAGQPFFAGAWAALRARRLGMDVPISLAMVLASAISLFETAQSGETAYFDAAVMLTFFLLIGRYLDHRSRAAARSAAAELAALEVPRATLIAGGEDRAVPVAQLGAGDLIRILPGARVAADGVIVTGTTEIDRSLLTGESLPVPAGPGAALSAGEVNLTGALVLRVTAAGQDSSLHRMAALVAVAEAARGWHTSLADRAARIYSPLVHLLSFGAFGFWMWQSGGDARLALNIAAAVLIITCPCALGLAVPAVVTTASGRLFRRGLLIKNGTALERLAQVDTVIFDKTGTLTLGRPDPVGLETCPAGEIALAAGLAAGSSHPLARALAAAARDAGIRPAPVSDLREVPGFGVEGRHAGRRVRLGRAEWVGAGAGAGGTGAGAGDLTAAYLDAGSGPVRAFAFADRLRPGAEAAVTSLRAQGLDVLILSGDGAGPVAALAARLGVADWAAGLRPEDKAARIAALRAAGRRVLMVGDGLNDTVALAAAHVSIAPASALDAARTASDMVLLGTDLAAVGTALAVARKARRRMIENFAISGLYNVVAVPLALVGLATPLAAALAMSLSSVSVSLNALRLR